MRETEKIMEYARLSGASYKAPAEMAYFLIKHLVLLDR